jgi:hypothetical protein
MNIAYYISAHGFGHGIRSCAIINEFGPHINIFIRSGLPETFLREEIERPVTFAPALFDCGCMQRDGITLDIQATITAYSRIAEANQKKLEAETAWCQAQDIHLIVSDIVPFAFDVAQATEIKSVAVTNFTWLDIYRPFCEKFPGFRACVDKIESQYKKADALLALYPALPMPYFRQIIPMGPVGRRGISRREELRRIIGCSPKAHLGLIYLGEKGMPEAD